MNMGLVLLKWFKSLVFTPRLLIFLQQVCFGHALCFFSFIMHLDLHV